MSFHFCFLVTTCFKHIMFNEKNKLKSTNNLIPKNLDMLNILIINAVFVGHFGIFLMFVKSATDTWIGFSAPELSKKGLVVNFPQKCPEDYI